MKELIDIARLKGISEEGPDPDSDLNIVVETDGTMVRMRWSQPIKDLVMTADDAAAFARTILQIAESVLTVKGEQ
jgi:hypothetical protein